MRLWLVGKYVNKSLWEFRGIFDTEQAAVFRCIDAYYFVAPCKLNARAPDETVSWPGQYYPLSEVENVVMGNFNAS